MAFRYKHCQSVYINSKYRMDYKNETSSNFTYKIDLDSNDYDSFCVVSASIPKSFYMIDTGFNTFTLKEEGVEYKITIQAGNYTFNSLKIELQNLLNEATNSVYTYVLSIPSSIEPSTGKITFSVAGNSGVQPSFIFEENNDIAEILGFVDGEEYFFENDILITPNVVFLTRNDSILLCSDMIKPTSTGVYNSQVIQQLYNLSPDFSFINYYCQDVAGNSRPLNHKSSNYRFNVCNSDGDTINLNGCNIQFTLLFYRHNDISEIQKANIMLDNFQKLSKSINTI